jgi:isocitrate/isopropylmalate dehydrogenase
MTTVAVIEGDDASPEAVRPVVALLEGMGLGIEWTYPEPGPEGLGTIDAADCTLFGATSGRSAAALFHLRWGRETYANVRPVRWIEGARSPLASPQGIDLVMVRENLEDVYVRAEGRLDELALPAPASLTWRRPVNELGPGRFAVKVITEAGSERVIRHAYRLAEERRGRLCISAKHNMLPGTDGLFVEVGRALAGSHPGVEVEVLIVDDLAHRLVIDPRRFDVIVLPNLYGDILSDLAAGLVGGLGMAPSACYGDRYAYFEPAHGTAPDLAGTGTINPTATLLSAAMMLGHLGFADPARHVVEAVEEIYRDGRVLTPDQGGTATADSFCAAVAEHLRH